MQNSIKSEYFSCKYCKKTNHDSNNCWFKQKHENRKENTVAFFINEKNQVPINEACFNEKSNENIFVVDSGCTSHLTNKL